MHPLVARLAQAREDAGLTRYALADLADLNKESLRSWEAGAHAPGLDRLERWAYALGYRIVLTEDGAPWDGGRGGLIEALARARTTRGLSQAHVAAAVPTSQSGLYLWETRRMAPTLTLLDRWAAALDYGLALTARSVR